MPPGGPTIASATRPGPIRLAEALVVFALVYPLLLTWVYFDLLAGLPAFVQQGAYWPGKAIQFALPLLFARLPTRSAATPPHSSGRPGRASGHLLGIAFGLAVAVAILGVSRNEALMAVLGPAIRAKAAGLGIATPVRFALVGLFYTLAHSFLEEWYWRGFVDRRLRGLIRAPAVAVTASSLGFAAHHALLMAAFLGWDSPVTWGVTAGVGVGGAFWAWLRDREGSLVAPWVSHAVVDAAVFTFGFGLIM